MAHSAAAVVVVIVGGSAAVEPGAEDRGVGFGPHMTGSRLGGYGLAKYLLL